MTHESHFAHFEWDIGQARDSPLPYAGFGLQFAIRSFSIYQIGEFEDKKNLLQLGKYQIFVGCNLIFFQLKSLDFEHRERANGVTNSVTSSTTHGSSRLSH